MKTIRQFFADVWLCISDPMTFAHRLRVHANRSAGAKRGWVKRKARPEVPHDIQ
jgi:hypothetical protein